jgi:hypothetical protein
MKPVAYLPTREAAAFLGLSLSAFYTMRSRDRRLRAHWLHGRMRFRLVDLEALLEIEPDRARPALRIVR